MLKGNMFDLKMAAGDSSDTRAGGGECGEGQPHPLESAKWIEKSSQKKKISLWKIKWKVVWIELELISCAKWKEGESVVRHRCSHRHVSSGTTSLELTEGSAGDRLQACFLLSLFQSVRVASALPHSHGEKREGAEKWSWMERDKEGKIKKEGQESESPGEKCDVAQWE